MQVTMFVPQATRRFFRGACDRERTAGARGEPTSRGARALLLDGTPGARARDGLGRAFFSRSSLVRISDRSKEDQHLVRVAHEDPQRRLLEDGACGPCRLRSRPHGRSAPDASHPKPSGPGAPRLSSDDERDTVRRSAGRRRPMTTKSPPKPCWLGRSSQRFRASLEERAREAAFRASCTRNARRTRRRSDLAGSTERATASSPLARSASVSRTTRISPGLRAMDLAGIFVESHGGPRSRDVEAVREAVERDLDDGRRTSRRSSSSKAPLRSLPITSAVRARKS